MASTIRWRWSEKALGISIAIKIVPGAFLAVKHKKKTAIRCEALSGKIGFFKPGRNDKDASK